MVCFQTLATVNNAAMTQRTDRQLSEGKGVGVWVKGVKGLNKEKHRHRQQCGDCQRERGSGGRWRRVKEGEMVMEGHLTWGGEHTIQYTDDVL